MARRADSGWRDSRLPLVHDTWGVPLPAAGLGLPFLEYDRGEAVAVVNYIRRDRPLPNGAGGVGATYRALSELRGPMGTLLPFISVKYDPRNWAMNLFGHNDPARDLIGASGWVPMTEEHFVRLLYRLRGRQLPNLANHGVVLSTGEWIEGVAALPPEGWAGQEMSVRRRGYEPEGQGVQFRTRNPCADIDLAVVGQKSGKVALVVDYKMTGAPINPGHKTHKAMSGLTDLSGDQIPSMIVQYDPTGNRWRYDVWCLNAPAQALLYGFMVRTNALAPGHGSCSTWTYVDEARWWQLLEEAQGR